MSEFSVEVVELGQTERHPNADSLSIATIFGGYPVIYRTEEFKPGDRVVYIPVDALLPLKDPLFAFLGDASTTRTHHRMKAKKLRGIFSMGMLIPAHPSWRLGQDVRELLGIEKWEPKITASQGDSEPDPGIMPVYTDLVSVRKYSSALVEGEPVIITEKLHGTNARFCCGNDRFWAGTHRTWRAPESGGLWWQVAASYELEAKLKGTGVGLYGEIYGSVQDLKYGTKPGELRFAAFDAIVLQTQQYMGPVEFEAFCRSKNIPMVPMLFVGPWSKDCWDFAEGPSTLAEHVREGCVVRPAEERWDKRAGRVVLKLVGEQYLLRKEKA